jgi:hypothetical protein
MRMHSQSGEANVPAIILSCCFLILCLAAAYYFIAVLPTQGVSDDSSSSSSMSSSMTTTSSVAPTGDNGATSSSAQMTAEEKAAYDACINAATEAHNQRWAASCSQKKEAQRSLNLACVNEGQSQTYCDAQFPYQNIDANCDLGLSRTNALNLQYAAGKKACEK